MSRLLENGLKSVNPRGYQGGQEWLWWALTGEDRYHGYDDKQFYEGEAQPELPGGPRRSEDTRTEKTHMTPFRASLREPAAVVAAVVWWLLIALPLGVCVGSCVALFLACLEAATRLRMDHPEVLWLLPAMGGCIGWLYWSVGKSVELGHNLVVDEIHSPGGGVPLRMAPLILISTVATHLCGGSAGREGTAIQMGGSLAGGIARLIPWLDRSDVPAILMAGVAAGFSSVFGTPVAGMVFSLEVLAIGRMRYGAILPCMLAAVVSDQTCRAWGITHVHYSLAPVLAATAEGQFTSQHWFLLACAVVGGGLFGLTSVVFTTFTHGIEWLGKRYVTGTRSIPGAILRPIVGGCLVIAMVQMLGTRDYLGLGVTSPDPDAVTIVTAFRPGGAQAWSWWWKILFTGVTLGSGFKGGEVTPLFFIGATLGNTLATLTGAPVDLLAALGFVSVFAGATNTPIACTLMAIELFGGENSLFFAVSCVMAYGCSGHTGIYRAQRIDTPKAQASSASVDMAPWHHGTP